MPRPRRLPPSRSASRTAVTFGSSLVNKAQKLAVGRAKRAITGAVLTAAGISGSDKKLVNKALKIMAPAVKRTKGTSKVRATKTVDKREMKSSELETLTANINSGGEVFLLSGVAQGTNQNQRIGMIIDAVSIEVLINLRGALLLNTYANIRIMLVKDKAPKGALAAVNDIVDLTGANDIGSLTRWSNRKRFKILSDRFFHNNNGSATTSGLETFMHYTVKTPGVHAFTGVDELIGSIDQNAIYIVVFGLVSNAAFPLNIASRFQYKDRA